MNAYHNSWPEEQQHLQRHQDLLSDAERRRLIRLAKGEVQAQRAPRLQFGLWSRLRCRLSGLVHLPTRTRAAATATSSDCR